MSKLTEIKVTVAEDVFKSTVMEDEFRSSIVEDTISVGGVPGSGGGRYLMDHDGDLILDHDGEKILLIR